MNMIKKIIMTLLCIDNIASFQIFAEDSSYKNRQKNQSIEQNSSLTTICATIAGVVTGAAIGYWLSELDSSSPENTHCSITLDHYSYDFEPTSPKSREVKHRLDGLKKYGQFFDLYDHEQSVILTLHKLGIRLHQIDSHFYAMLQADNKVLSDAGYSIWWYSLKELEAQKNIYLSNSNKIVTFFYRHRDFIQACQTINSYDQLLSYNYDIHHWIYAQSYRYDQYPLISCKNHIESDRKALSCLQYSRQYPALAQKIQTVCRLLDSILELICRSNEYQHQLIQKKQDELQAEARRIEAERLEIARQQIKIQEEANRIAAERNRIEADKFFRD